MAMAPPNHHCYITHHHKPKSQIATQNTNPTTTHLLRSIATLLQPINIKTHDVTQRSTQWQSSQPPCHNPHTLRSIDPLRPRLCHSFGHGRSVHVTNAVCMCEGEEYKIEKTDMQKLWGTRKNKWYCNNM